MKKILWLASWYPNKISPLNGDFIQRHAEATAGFDPVHVIFVVKDGLGAVTNKLTTENFTRGNLSESITYYKPFSSGIALLDRIISLFTYYKILHKMLSSFIKNNGEPKLVHVHVAMFAGIMALWLKKRNNIPYLITEHWTGYDKSARENIYNKGWFFKYILRSVLKHAELVLPVSMQLGNTIGDEFPNVALKQVSNVVNTSYFHLSNYTQKEFTFIHVSSMSWQKNIEGILNSFSKLLITNNECKLVMVGPALSGMREKADLLNLKNNIEWKGAIDYKEVAAAMSSASALLLFSRYENQPCVILEALCCGLPVIATDTGGIPEIINKDNGILVSSENEPALLDAMRKMIKNYGAFDKELISKTAVEKYNYESMGKIISNLYGTYALP